VLFCKQLTVVGIEKAGSRPVCGFLFPLIRADFLFNNLFLVEEQLNAEKGNRLARILNLVSLFWLMEIIATLLIGTISFNFLRQETNWVRADIERSIATQTLSSVTSTVLVLTSTETPIPTVILAIETKLPDVGNIVPNEDNNSYNGYFWNNYWIPGLASFDTQFLRLPRLSVGSAVAYAPEVMEATAAFRGLSMDGFVGAVSAEFASEIGHSVWLLRPNETIWEGPFIVVDCSRRNDLYGQIMFQDQVVEVDFETAIRWGLMQRGGPGNGLGNAGRWTALMWRMDGVLLSTINPNQLVENEPVTDLSEWFLQNITFAKQSENRYFIRNYEPPANGVGLPRWLLGDNWVTFP